MSMKGLFGRIAEAKTYESGNYFEAGEYEADILETFINEGHKGTRGIVETLVVSSSASEPGKTPAPVGSKRSIVFVLDGEHKDVGLGKMKSFVLGSLVPAEERPSDAELSATMEEVYADACRTNGIKNKGEKQPLRGKRVRIIGSTASKPTKKTAHLAPALQVFPVNLKFVFVPQDGAAIDARRKELDAANL